MSIILLKIYSLPYKIIAGKNLFEFANQYFSLTIIKEIEHIALKGVDPNNWNTHSFELELKALLTYDELSTPSTIRSKQDFEKSHKIIDSLTPPKEGEVNFMRLQARRHENGDLHVTVLIRNGSPKTINIPQLPLQMDIHLPGITYNNRRHHLKLLGRFTV